MAWMKVEHETPDKPEVLAIAASLSVSPDEAFGICFRMWRWFDQHTQDGNAVSVTSALLNRVLGVSGFAESALAVGWLEVVDLDGKPSLRCPNFDRHNGETAKQRALTAKRVAQHKTKGNAKGNATTVTSSVSSALPREREEKEKSIRPPKSPKGDLVLPELPLILNTADFRKQLETWLKYRGASAYKPEGLAAMVSRAANLAATHGTPAIIEAMQKAMANGWKGWDQFDHQKPTLREPPPIINQPVPRKVNKVDWSNAAKP